MPPFQLRSDFKPTGDQPEAIAQLVAGLQRGDRHQVLLGATGTGKSLGHDDPVFVVEERDGRRQARVCPIGELVDGLFALHPAGVVRQGDAQVLHLDSLPARYFAQSFDPETGRTGLYPIRSFVRHPAPAAMYRVATACGRSATLTGDHNLWVLRDGRLQLIETADALPADHLPLPESLLGEGHLGAIDLAEASGVSLAAAPALAAVPAGPAGRDHGAPPVQWLPAHDAQGSAAQAPTLPHSLALTPALLRLIGAYVAAGEPASGGFLLPGEAGTSDAITAVLDDLGLPYARRPAGCHVTSAPFADLLASQCGATSAERRLPAFWPDLSNDSLGQLLRTCFDAAGAVPRNGALSVTTRSAQLASELAYALLRFGIWARLSSPWQGAGDGLCQVTILGQADLRRFQHDVGFSSAERQDELDLEICATPPSGLDAVAVDGGHLRWLRQELGLSAAELEGCGLSRAAIQAVEGGRRVPSRVDVLLLLAGLGYAAQKAEHMQPDWWSAWERLHGLCRLRWTPLGSVERVPYAQPYVYDFCVPGAETFLAGAGGFLVHNTFTIANVVAQVQKPTLVMAHNKTLAAQLYAEFKEFFPRNAVEYFVSYYDYYQPEAYVARHDLYIEKETEINEEIDRLRLAATAALLSRRDVLIVASVSCIYGLGSPDAWRRYMVHLQAGDSYRRNALLRQLVTIQYERNDVELKTGVFRVRGDTLELIPVGYETGFRVAFFGDEIERIAEFDVVTGEILSEHPGLDIFPARHFITEEDKLRAAIGDIEQELEERIAYFKQNNLLLEAQRIEQRTRYDLEMLREVGYCSGIENYSRPLDRRPAGSPPQTLVDYFPQDYLLVIDESHMTVPQIGGMYGGDRSRKEELIKYGFRLPSALDNRPLSFAEFEQRLGQVVYTSATPGPYEMERAAQVVQQIIRPTGLVDPEVEVRPTKGQIDDLVAEIRRRVERGERVLVTTLTKRMAEDLADYVMELGLRVHYLHSEIDTLERVEILRDLRLGVYDVVVGINLLREGLDLPEVSLVAILDADKEGFLRSGTSLIQTIGRAARHVHGRVLMYADKLTDSMRFAIDETNRRRQIQVAYNEEHHIVPAGIVKSVRDLTARLHAVADEKAPYHTSAPAQLPKDELAHLIKELEKQMKEAAQHLEFEKAALLRDQIFELRQALVEKDQTIPPWQKAQKLAELED